MEPAAETPKGAPRLFGGFGVDALGAGLLLLVGTILFLSVAPYTFQIYLAIHVVSAVVWVGGDVTLTTLGIVFERRGDGETLAALGRMGTWIGTRVYTPTLFVVIAFGIALMHEGHIDWGQFWVDLRADRLGDRRNARHRLRRPRARPHRRGRACARAAVRRGRAPGEAALHDLPLRYGPAHSDRARHDRTAVLVELESE